jgi:hypothetical protein
LVDCTKRKVVLQTINTTNAFIFASITKQRRQACILSYAAVSKLNRKSAEMSRCDKKKKNLAPKFLRSESSIAINNKETVGIIAVLC